jgi:hypothetical protein
MPRTFPIRRVNWPDSREFSWKQSLVAVHIDLAERWQRLEQRRDAAGENAFELPGLEPTRTLIPTTATSASISDAGSGTAATPAPDAAREFSGGAEGS